MGKVAFVTVGTTQFDLLVETVVCDEHVRRALTDCLHVDTLVLQTGKSHMPPVENTDMDVQSYDYKGSIEHDIRRADLVISHAGAGTILETLEARKPLLVVVNEKLMDNHQLEIAHEMEKQGYLFHCTCSTLAETLRKFAGHTFKQYDKGNPKLFGDYLNMITAV